MNPYFILPFLRARRRWSVNIGFVQLARRNLWSHMAHRSTCASYNLDNLCRFNSWPVVALQFVTRRLIIFSPLFFLSALPFVALDLRPRCRQISQPRRVLGWFCLEVLSLVKLMFYLVVLLVFARNLCTAL